MTRPTLSAVHVERARVTLHTSGPRPLTLPRPVTFTRRAQVGGPDVLTAHTLPPLAPHTVAFHVEPDTRAGQAVLTGLGWAGPYPAPQGEHLAGYTHGQPLSAGEALQLAARPDFPEVWAIVPSPDGQGLALMWGNDCTLGELQRASDWNAQHLAALHPQRGRA
ncbi:hypothetical protein K7W42_07605 [Deinococcus sp. HMF7604]|uniref:hypothetical protein n=1 Tax=Deinococcus betulae TaxID=2873312 RepID=UPI001CCA4989|nr:hypothetical protein [Deinococcus betulae]MBZ9750724.1 hypothetical protein [Deinococcus betulae]